MKQELNKLDYPTGLRNKLINHGAKVSSLFIKFNIVWLKVTLRQRLKMNAW